MYIIGRVNVNATAFSLSPLSLSVIQRHDLWLVSDFRSHPSTPGFTTGLHAVNHAEGLSFIPLNPSRVCFRVALRRKLSKVAVEGARGMAGASGTWGINCLTWVRPGPNLSWPLKTGTYPLCDLRKARSPKSALFCLEMSAVQT